MDLDPLEPCWCSSHHVAACDIPTTASQSAKAIALLPGSLGHGALTKPMPRLVSGGSANLIEMDHRMNPMHEQNEMVRKKNNLNIFMCQSQTCVARTRILPMVCG